MKFVLGMTVATVGISAAFIFGSMLGFKLGEGADKDEHKNYPHWQKSQDYWKGFREGYNTAIIEEDE